MGELRTRSGSGRWMEISRRSSRGTALVEFMITAPILLLAFAGALDLGRAFYYEVLISDAARDGARVMIGDSIPTGSLTTGPGFNAICGAVKADLTNVASVSCQQVMRPSSPPYVPGVDYTAPGPDQAVAVIYCGGVAVPCDLPGPTGGHPLHQTAEIDIFYGFGPVTPMISQLAPGGLITMKSRAQGLTNW